MFIVVIVLSFCVNCSTRMRMSKQKNVLREDEENRTDIVVESLRKERGGQLLGCRKQDLPNSHQKLQRDQSMK